MCLWPLTPLCRTAWCAGKAACARPSWETLAWRRKYQITGQSITSVFIMTSINTLRLDKSRSISYIPLLLHFCLIYLSHRICRSKVFINVSRSFSFLFRWDIVTHKERHITHTKAQSGFSKVCMCAASLLHQNSLFGELFINTVKRHFKGEEGGMEDRQRLDSQRWCPYVIWCSVVVASLCFLLCVCSCVSFLICGDIYAAYFIHRRLSDQWSYSHPVLCPSAGSAVTSYLP